jgi:hypothetical protein
MKWHTTRDGKKMLIAQMDDSHLCNQINLLCQNFLEARQGIENAKSMDTVTMILSGYTDNGVIERLKETIEHYHNILQPYVFEAALRGIDVSTILQIAYGRTKGLVTLPSLNSATIKDEDDLD